MEKCLIFIFLSLFLLLVSSPFGEKKTYERKDVTVCKEKNQYDVALDEDAYANSQSLSSSPLLSLYLFIHDGESTYYAPYDIIRYSSDFLSWEYEGDTFIIEDGSSIRTPPLH